jgi:hypothetical protein
MLGFGYFKALSRLSVIEDTLIALSKRVEESETDWTDMHSRCRKLMLRAEKAASREEDVESDSSGPTNGEGGMSSLVHHALTPRQRAVQSQILTSRRGRG